MTLSYFFKVNILNVGNRARKLTKYQVPGTRHRVALVKFPTLEQLFFQLVILFYCSEPLNNAVSYLDTNCKFCLLDPALYLNKNAVSCSTAVPSFYFCRFLLLI